MVDLSMSGRPRSKEATQLVLKAALELAHEGGLQYATVERISQKSGVAKSTIYRRWANAGAVVLNAFLDEISPLIEYKSEGKISEIMKYTVKMLAKALKGKRGELLRNILGLAQTNPEIRNAFVSHWINPRREMGEKALKSAVEKGEIRRDADLGLILDTIYGAFYYRLTVSFAQLDARFVDQIVDRALCGLLLN